MGTVGKVWIDLFMNMRMQILLARMMPILADGLIANEDPKEQFFQLWVLTKAMTRPSS